MRSLVVGEWEHDALAESTRRAVTAALQRGFPVDVMVPAAGAEAASGIAGVERVLVIAGDAAHAQVPETLGSQLQAVSDDYTLIVASHRNLGRSALPRAAALTDGAFLADVTGIDAQGSFTRGLYAGSVIAKVSVTARVTFATIRTSSFVAAEPSGGAATIVETKPAAAFEKTRLLERQASGQSRRDLGTARVVVAGGRGMASKDNMDRLGGLAERVGAALGASRAAVDAGYAPNAVQVGQTGKTVAPDLYFAFGISGAIQHLAGMKDSKVIVAVNKDPDAPIFSVADYGIVGDLFDVLGELEAHVSAKAA
ncbi:electron transfer flavoprotein subunit alpha/FixB family protein [Paraburkholderia sp. UYCP14C]|uniref:electron transfer flavoprotein subunit alpha/FixB family protein n=1 Tax=Paraburkholderia sp. UYCP14C TaxID=2511130 RepID=UPI0010226CF4|nr:electron transfer flavoprotein subunit alpha/FixB family protein [Paraburkholderia sp. UYCP14C]RZF26716.1 electron transfer flavoprotein subunit alpha/FixB family protein [Paraburkholderia sp. UYCP14C]